MIDCTKQSLNAMSLERKWIVKVVWSYLSSRSCFSFDSLFSVVLDSLERTATDNILLKLKSHSFKIRCVSFLRAHLLAYRNSEKARSSCRFAHCIWPQHPFDKQELCLQRMLHCDRKAIRYTYATTHGVEGSTDFFRTDYQLWQICQKITVCVQLAQYEPKSIKIKYRR